MRLPTTKLARIDRRPCPLLQTGSVLLAALGVIVIIGLSALLLSMVTRSDPRGKLQLEAQTLARMLALAAAEARYTGKALAWTADDSGYRFWQLNPNNGWSELEGNGVLRARTLPEGMFIYRLKYQNFEEGEPRRVEFAAWGEIPDFAVGLTLDAASYQITASTLGEFRAAPVRELSGNVVVLR